MSMVAKSALVWSLSFRKSSTRASPFVKALSENRACGLLAAIILEVLKALLSHLGIKLETEKIPSSRKGNTDAVGDALGSCKMTILDCTNQSVAYSPTAQWIMLGCAFVDICLDDDSE